MPPTPVRRAETVPAANRSIASAGQQPKWPRGLVDQRFCIASKGLKRLSLLKTVNYQESLGIFLCDRRTVGRQDHHSICSRFHALVPVSQPSVAGTRACRPATSADCLAAATPSPPPASFRRSAPVGVPYMSFAESSVLFRIGPQAPLSWPPSNLMLTVDLPGGLFSAFLTRLSPCLAALSGQAPTARRVAPFCGARA